MQRKISSPPLNTWTAVVAAVAACAVLGGAASGALQAPPANDDFAAAFTLSGDDTSRTGDTTIDATLEAGEPLEVHENPAGASIWYVWTAPEDGQVTIDTATSNFDTLLAAYLGTAVSALTEVASNDDADGLTSAMTFDATNGTTYRIRVDGFQGAMGTVNLHLRELLHPPNDKFANAFVLPAADVTRDGDTNVAASLEPGEPTRIAGSATGASVWYTLTPGQSCRVRLDTATTDFDTLLAVYTGHAVNDLTEVTSNDDAGPAPNVTSAVSFGTTPGTVYRISVGGFEGATGPINLHEVYGDVPGAPTGVTAVAGAGQATVAWTTPVADGCRAISGYEITRYVGGVTQGVTSVGLTDQASVSGLANGTAYTFKVAAKNVLGTGPQSAESSSVIPKAVPEAPAGVTAVPGAGSATVSWTAPSSDGGSAITGYEVTSYAGAAVQGVTSVGVVTQATIAGLTNGTAYTFRVAARNGIGTGAPAESTPVIPRTVPGAPGNVTAVAGNGDASVSWTAPLSNGGSEITGYDVTAYAAGAAQGVTFVGAVTQATIAGLANGVAYTFRVAAENVAGAGAQSSESGSVKPDLPKFALSIMMSGTGTGTVTSTVGGIDCGTVCTSSFVRGAGVTLNAVPDIRSTFAGWSGACNGGASCSITMDAAKFVVARFDLVPMLPKAFTCIVPKLTGRMLPFATRKLVARHCRVGAVAKVRSTRVAKGRIVSQRPNAGVQRAPGTKVKLVVSLGAGLTKR